MHGQIWSDPESFEGSGAIRLRRYDQLSARHSTQRPSIRLLAPAKSGSHSTARISLEGSSCHLYGQSRRPLAAAIAEPACAMSGLWQRVLSAVAKLTGELAHQSMRGARSCASELATWLQTQLSRGSVAWLLGRAATDAYRLVRLGVASSAYLAQRRSALPPHS